MAITQTLMYMLAMNTDDFQKGIGSSLAQIEVLRGAFNDMMTPIIDLGDEMQTLASGFESGFANVNTLLDNGEEQIKQYKSAVLALSLEVPQAATELTDGLYQVISAGIDAGDAMDVLAVAAKAATAGLSDSFTAVDVITTLLNSYSMDASEAGHVSDVLFATVKAGKTTFGELASSMGMFAASAAAANVPLEETAAFMATATKNGLSTAIAATSLNATLRELGMNKEVEKMFKAMGYESSQAAINTLGLQGSIGALKEAADKAGKPFANIWGDEARRGVLVLANNLGVANQDLAAMKDSADAASIAFGKSMDTLENTQQLLQNQRDAFKIMMGQTMLPLTQKYTEAQVKLYGVLNKMPPALLAIGGAGVKAGSGLAKLVNLSGDMARNFVALRDGISMVREFWNSDAMFNIAYKFEEWKTGANSAADGHKNLNQQMEITKGKSIDLKGAIGAAGLGLAIAFTTRQLDKLQQAFKDYMAAVGELQAQEAKYTDSIKTYNAESAQSNAEAQQALRDYIELEKNHQKLGSKLNSLKIAEYRQQKKVIEERFAALGEEFVAIDDLGQAEAKLADVTDRLNNLRIEAHGQHQSDVTDEIVTTEEATQATFDYAGAIVRLTAELENLNVKASQRKKDETDQAYYERLLAQRTEALGKISERREKMIAQIEASITNQQHKAELDRLRGTAEYYDKLIQYENEALAERITQTEASQEYRYANEAERERLMTAIANDSAERVKAINADKNQFVIDDEQRKNDEIKRLNDEALAEQQKHVDAMVAVYGGLIDAGAQLFTAFGEANTDSMKSALKNILNELIRFVEIKLVLGEAASFAQALFNPAALIKNVPLLITAEAGLNLARGLVASLNTGGVTTGEGMAMLHRNEVVINPEQSNGVISALAAQLGGQRPNIVVEDRSTIDARGFVRNVVVREIDSHNRQYSDKGYSPGGAIE